MSREAERPGIPIDVPLEGFTHPDALPHTRVSRVLDAWIRSIGNALSWVWLALLAVIVLNVTLRYAFGEGRIEFEELQWHLYSIGFLVGLSYCVESDSHIRVDFLHERFSGRLQAWVELYGILLLLLPFVALLLIFSLPFIAHSFEISEVSSAPGGLGFRWAIKAALFAGFALLGLSAISRLTRVCAYLFTREDEAPAQPPEAGAR
jgi:TRAP-type mannitol/chloroaromatic compound transport system permease small subunit